MKNTILKILEESIKVKEDSVKQNVDNIISAVKIIADRIKAKNKIYIFGNGGSAADAQHIAAEFVNRFEIERPPLPAISLTTDTSILTSIGNDYDYCEIFSKQIRAYCKKDDIAWGISTSGNSKNVVLGLEAAKNIGAFTIGMTGIGGKITECSDICFKVDSKVTARIQETHITISHIICKLVDEVLFSK